MSFIKNSNVFILLCLLSAPSYTRNNLGVAIGAGIAVAAVVGAKMMITQYESEKSVAEQRYDTYLSCKGKILSLIDDTLTSSSKDELISIQLKFLDINKALKKATLLNKARCSNDGFEADLHDRKLKLISLLKASWISLHYGNKYDVETLALAFGKQRYSELIKEIRAMIFAIKRDSRYGHAQQKVVDHLLEVMHALQEKIKERCLEEDVVITSSTILQTTVTSIS